MIFWAVCPNGGFREHLTSGHTVQRIFVGVDLAISHSSPRMAFPELFCACPGLRLSPLIVPASTRCSSHTVRRIVQTNAVFLRVRAADTINARHSLRRGSQVSLNSYSLCEFARLFWSRDPPFDYPSRSPAPRAQNGLVGQGRLWSSHHLPCCRAECAVHCGSSEPRRDAVYHLTDAEDFLGSFRLKLID
jgi:hypothetical protein